jgi:DNA polymerase III epsilon subunit-like protein
MPNFLVMFDLETGGLLPTQPTISLAAVAAEEPDLREVSSFHSKITFAEADCDPEALMLNGYTADAWAQSVTPARAAQSFAAWMKPYHSITMTSKRTGNPYTLARLSGFNALLFDLPRLKALFGAEFFPCSHLVRDVFQRAVFYFDEHPHEPLPENFKLATLGAYFGLNVDGAHDALFDARLSLALLRELRERS